MTRELDARLTELTAVSAGELEARSREQGLSRVNERDHLQPACAAAARRLAASWRPPAEVSTSLRIRSEHWPRLGAIDLALGFPGKKPVAVELKCGSGRDALGPCAWDALKLAFMLERGELSAGCLLAATPASDWGSAFRGVELFETGPVDTLALRERFLDWWRQWERLGDPTPTLVPRRFETRAVARVPFALEGRLWELRLAALACERGDCVEWLPTREPSAP